MDAEIESEQGAYLGDFPPSAPTTDDWAQHTRELLECVRHEFVVLNGLYAIDQPTSDHIRLDTDALIEACDAALDRAPTPEANDTTHRSTDDAN